MWSIKIQSKNEIVWSGKSAPDIVTLSRVIPSTIQPSDLTSITVQILSSAPLEALPTLLTALCSVYLRSSTTGVIDVNALSSIAATEQRMVCGRVFKKGDIVWNCRTCGKDPTCVQCDPCFRKADHTGHEVYFHRAEGGSGCCDCGDPEAWASHGNCTDHQPKIDQESFDPTANLPEEVKSGFQAVLQGCFGWISSYLILKVRSFEPIQDNMVVQMLRDHYPTASAVLRVHNDDVHTYDEVIRTFKTLGFNDIIAKKLTTEVDKDGNAVLFNGLIGHDSFDEYSETIHSAGLICSIFPTELLPIEDRIPCILSWLITLGDFSDGFRRVITESLLRERQEEVGLTSRPVITPETIACYYWPELQQYYTLQTIFQEEGQFPIEVRQLSNLEFVQVPLSANVSMTSNEHLSESEGNKNTFSLSPTDELKDRIRRPFRYCSVNPLSLILLASPFLSISTQKGVMEMIMKFQHDFLFKCGFSQMLTVLYPTLMTLFIRHYGLAQETIFRATVQVYTANSIVELMSSIGWEKRKLSEKDAMISHQKKGPEDQRYLLITNMIISMLHMMLRDLGGPNSTEFLQQHALRTHRISMMCRDLEYVTTDPYFCLELLTNRVNRGTMDLWIDICMMLQYLDRMKRQTVIHVEHEDDQWQQAANLLLEIESISEHWIANALLNTSMIKVEDKEFYQFPSTTTIAMSGSTREEKQIYLQELQQQGFEQSLLKTLQGIFVWFDRKNFDNFQTLSLTSFTGLKSSHSFQIVHYLVSQQAFSIHIPLHRLFMKIIRFGCHGDLSCQTLFTTWQSQFRESELLLLMDYPLRCLVFHDQVLRGLWKRNGLAASNLAYNYSRIPLNRTLHDMDVLALQVVGQLVSVPSFYGLLWQRYEYLDWMLEPIRPLSKEAIHLIGDSLHLLLQVVLYLPTVLFPQSSRQGIPGVDYEGVKLALIREVFHQMLVGHRTMTALAKVKKLIGTFGTVGDQLLRDVLHELTTRSTLASRSGGSTATKASDPSTAIGESGGNEGMIQLREESYQYYDPEFPSLTPKQSIEVMDMMKLRLRGGKGHDLRELKIGWNSSRFHSNPYLPLLYEKAIPIPHRDFLSLRLKLLCSSTFLEMTFRLLHHLCLSNDSHRNFYRTTLLGRLIELWTILCYLLPPSLPKEAVETKEVEEEMKENLLLTSESERKSLLIPFLKYFQKYQIGYQCLQLFVTNIYETDILKEEELYQDGLGFVLYESQVWSEDIYQLLVERQFLSPPASSTINTTEKSEENPLVVTKSTESERKEALQKAARERMMAQSKLQAEKAMAAFAGMMSDSDSDSETAEEDNKEEDAEEEEMDVMETSAFHPSEDIFFANKLHETCIICRDKKENSPLGYLCFIQPSNTLQHHTYQYAQQSLFSTTNSSSRPTFDQIYRVVAQRGCPVHESPSEMSPVVDTLSFNQHVVTGQRSGQWIQIIAPIKGYGLIYHTVDEQDGEDPHGRSTPIPLRVRQEALPVTNPINLINHPYSNDYLTVLAPIKPLLYQQNGGTRLHISTCSHVMHFDCWDDSFSAAYARYINREGGAEAQAYDMTRGEWLCPFCKTIINGIVPILPDVSGVNLRCHRISHGTSFEEEDTSSTGADSVMRDVASNEDEDREKEDDDEDEDSRDEFEENVLAPPQSFGQYVPRFIRSITTRTSPGERETEANQPSQQAPPQQQTTDEENDHGILLRNSSDTGLHDSDVAMIVFQKKSWTKRTSPLSSHDAKAIHRFLDNLFTTTTNMMPAFPINLSKIIPFPGTIHDLHMEGLPATQISYDSFVNRFLFGDWKLLQSSMSMISTTAYSFSLASYRNLAIFLQEGEKDENVWALPPFEERIYSPLFNVLPHLPDLFHQYVNEWKENNHHEQVFSLDHPQYAVIQEKLLQCYQQQIESLKNHRLLEVMMTEVLEMMTNPVFYHLYQVSLERLWGLHSEQWIEATTMIKEVVNNKDDKPPFRPSFHSELLSLLSHFPSFPLITNIQTQYPDLKTLYDLLLRLCSEISTQRSNGQEGEVPYEVISVLSKYYQVFHQPLLAQDLTFIAVSMIPLLYQPSVATTISREWFDKLMVPMMTMTTKESVEGTTESSEEERLLQQWMLMLLLAKLNQILIDPKVTGVFNHSDPLPSEQQFAASSSSAVENTILREEGLRQLYHQIITFRKEVYTILKLPLPSDDHHLHLLDPIYSNSPTLDGQLLLQEIFLSLIPFLEVLLRMYQYVAPTFQQSINKGNKKKASWRTVPSPSSSVRDLLRMSSTGTKKGDVSSTPSLEEKNHRYLRYINAVLRDCFGWKSLSLQSLLHAALVPSPSSPSSMLGMIRYWNLAYHAFHIDQPPSVSGSKKSEKGINNQPFSLDLVKKRGKEEVEGLNKGDSDQLICLNRHQKVIWYPYDREDFDRNLYMNEISALKPLPPAASNLNPIRATPSKAPSTSRPEDSTKQEELPPEEQIQLLQLLQQQQQSQSRQHQTVPMMMTGEEGEDEGDAEGIHPIDDFLGETGPMTDNFQELLRNLLLQARRGANNTTTNHNNNNMTGGNGTNTTNHNTRRRNNSIHDTDEEDNESDDVDMIENIPPPNVANDMLEMLLANLTNNTNTTNTTGRRSSTTTANHTTGTATATTATTRTIPPWSYYGVLPMNAFVDEISRRLYTNTLVTLETWTSARPTRLMLQSSITGHYPIYTIDPTQFPLQLQRLVYQYPDLSHFNIRLDGLQQLNHQFSLIPLPRLYIDLYHLAKFPEGPNGITLEDPAICLLCGQILCAARKRNQSRLNRSLPFDSAQNPGECTLHAMQCGTGIGIFFLIQSCNVLLLRGSRASYYATIYLDEHQESNADSGFGYGHNKPMFLSTSRYQQLKDMYLQHRITKEVSRKRLTGDTVIRQFWY